MLRTITLPVVSLAVCLLGGCASFNRVEMHQHRQTSIGKELEELQQAKDKGLLSEAEYAKARKDILAWSSVEMTGETVEDGKSEKPAK